LSLGVSLCKVIEFFLYFTTTPSSPRTEFVCILFFIFVVDVFIGSSLWEVLHLSFLAIFYLGISWISSHVYIEIIAILTKKSQRFSQDRNLDAKLNKNI
jgi:hypothetical protein